MKGYLSQSSLVVLTFAVAFAICGFRLLCGYQLEPSTVLVCSIWSFFAGIVQVLETVMSFFEESKNRFISELSDNNLDDDITLNNTEQWYSRRYNVYNSAITIIMFVSLLLGLCWILLGWRYENGALSDGLTLMAIGMIFLSMFIRDYAKEKITNYKLKKY